MPQLARLVGLAIEGRAIKRDLAMGLSILLGAQACFLLLPLQVRPLVAALDSDRTPEDARALLVQGTTRMVGLYVVRVILGTTGRHILGRCGDAILAQLQVKIFNAMQRIGIEDFERMGEGRLLSLLEQDAAAIRTALTNNLERVAVGGLYVVGGLAICLYLSAFLTAVVVASVLPIVLSSLALRTFNERSGKELSRARAHMVDHARCILGATRLVRSYMQEQAEVLKYRGLAQDYVRQSERYSARMNLFQGAAGFSHSIALVVIIYVGVGRATLDGGLSPASLVALINVVVEIGKHLEAAVGNALGLFAALGKAQAIIALLETAQAAAEEDARAAETDPFPTGPSSELVLQFERASYAYPGAEASIEDVSFAVPRGQCVALVGPSGAGKSTLLDLVSKFKACSSGRVLLHGRNLDEVSRSACRRQLAVAQQAHAVLPGSLLENVVYGSETANEKAIARAVAQAGAEDFAGGEALGRTAAGDGYALSGGQKARVAIARALLKPASILVLDEPSAALDAAKEDALFRELKAHVKASDQACLFVTHRMRMAEIADTVVVMKEGRVVQMGTHAELYAQENGLYRHLHSIQCA